MAALTDCYSCADKRLRAVTGAARLYGLADPAEPREAAQQVGLPVCDTSAPCHDAAKRHAALHTLAWRLALGKNLVLLCWCAPKACHLTAVADNITARAFFYAATLECLGVDGAPGVPALGPPALLIPDCDSVCADVSRQRQRSLEPRLGRRISWADELVITSEYFVADDRRVAATWVDLLHAEHEHDHMAYHMAMRQRVVDSDGLRSTRAPPLLLPSPAPQMPPPPPPPPPRAPPLSWPRAHLASPPPPWQPPRPTTAPTLALSGIHLLPATWTEREELARGDFAAERAAQLPFVSKRRAEEADPDELLGRPLPTPHPPSITHARAACTHSPLPDAAPRGRPIAVDELFLPGVYLEIQAAIADLAAAVADRLERARQAARLSAL